MRLLLILLLLPFTAFGTITISTRGTGTDATTSTTIACNPGSTIAAGSTAVLCISADNSFAGGVIGSNFPAGPLTDTAGNKWYKMAGGGHDPGASNGGVEVQSWYAFMTTQLTSGGSVTFTFTTAVPTKAWAFTELAPTTGNVVLWRTGGFTAGSSTATPSSTISQWFCVLDNVIMGFGGAKGTDTWVADAGSSQGAWQTGQHAGSAAGSTTGTAVITQYKAMSANSTGGQTYAPTLTLASNAVGTATFQEGGPNSRGVQGVQAGATSTAAFPSIALAAGTFGVLWVASDNAGASGSTAIWPTTGTDSSGNTWTQQRDMIYNPGSAANTGVESAVYTATITTALAPDGNVALAHVGSVSTANRLWSFYTYSPGASFTVAGSGDNGGSTGTTPTLTTSSIVSGDTVICAGSIEQLNTWAMDADTSNGSWSPGVTIGANTGAAGVALITQDKTVTGTGTQTFNPTITSSGDGILGYIQIHNATGPTAAQKAAFFYLFP